MQNHDIPENELEVLHQYLKNNDISSGITKGNELIASFPSSTKVLKALGYCHARSGNLESAFEFNKRAYETAPSDPEIAFNTAVALYRLKRFKEAGVFCLNTLRADQSHQTAAKMLCEVTRNTENKVVAEAKIKEYHLLFPNSAFLTFQYATYLSRTGKIESSLELYERARSLIDTGENILNPLEIYSVELFLLSQHLQTTDEYLEKAKQFDVIAETHLNKQIEDTAPRNYQHNKIRVGFTSGDFKMHSMVNFIKPILNLDQNRFTTYLYSNTKQSDDITKQVANNSNIQWRDISQKPYREIYKTILADEIDILVDLSGHTKNNILTIFSMRAAPIQITWMGYGYSTGLSNMDYILCDQNIINEQNASQLTEAPLFLPNSWLCYTPPYKEAEISISKPPITKNGYITFGSFNNFQKVTKEAIDAWACILSNTENSKLLLKSSEILYSETEEYIRETLERHGIDRHRINFESFKNTPKDHLETYNKIDIALDTFPYCGGTTTCEALWMATPVITFSGNNMVNRMGNSILKTAGFEDCIAYSIEEYINLAIKKSEDIDYLDRVNINMREQLLSSPLCDIERFTKDLENNLSLINEKLAS